MTDLERSVKSYLEPITESTPHIYLSALPWAFENSQTRTINDAVMFKNLPLIAGTEQNKDRAMGEEDRVVKRTLCGVLAKRPLCFSRIIHRYSHLKCSNGRGPQRTDCGEWQHLQ